MADNGWIKREPSEDGPQASTAVVRRAPVANTVPAPLGLPPHLWQQARSSMGGQSNTRQPALPESGFSSVSQRENHPFTNPDHKKNGQNGPAFRIGEQPRYRGIDDVQYHPALQDIINKRRVIYRNDPTSITQREIKGDPLTAAALRNIDVVPRVVYRTVALSNVTVVTAAGEGGIVRDQWIGDDGTDHEEFRPDFTAFHDFIREWLSTLPDKAPTAAIMDHYVENNYLYDIDTDTGKLMEAVEQPHSMQTIDVQIPASKQKELFLNLNHTAFDEVHVKSRLQARKDIKDLAAKADVRRTARELLAPVVQKPHATGRRIGVSCYLRPATADDAPEIAKLYNWEIKNGSQTVETEALMLHDIYSIIGLCRLMKVPFIVAIQGTVEFSEARKSAKETMNPDAFKDYPQLAEMATDKVLGFAYVDFADRGAGGTCQSTGALTGKLYFCVHPDYRRKGLGMALMDKALACCCPRWVAGDYYVFENPDNNRLYGNTALNSCRLLRLNVDILYKTKTRTELDSDALETRSWYEKFLTRTFPFKEVLEQLCYYRRDDGKEQTWLDKVTYQVVCRGLNEIDGY